MLRHTLLAIVAALALATIAVALTASSVVPATKLSDRSSAITAQALAPGICGGILLTTVVAGNGAIVAPGFQQLILGGPAAQAITGTAGRDCILGGEGADVLNGGALDDVCIGSVTAIFVDCETQVVQ
jgi:hypothetical protein